MSSLTYVGTTSTEDEDVETRLSTDDIFGGGISRSYVSSKIAAAVALRGSKTYIDAQDGLYALKNYYPARDALLVPLTDKGIAGGVATLGADSKVPSAQVPVLGAGILRGPWGPTTVYGGSTQTTPLKIAEWALGISGVTGQPWAWLSTSIQCSAGRPVVEIRMGDSTQTAYEDQTLIAIGIGRSFYVDYQMVTVFSATDTLGEVTDDWTPATDLLVNAWMYCEGTGTVTTSTGSLASAALYLARKTL